MFSAKRYPEDIRTKAIEAVNQRRLVNPRDRTIYREIAEQFNIGEQSLRLWVKKQDINPEDSETINELDSGADEPKTDDYTPMTQAELEVELRKLRSNIEKLKAENQLLKKAFVVFSADWSK